MRSVNTVAGPGNSNADSAQTSGRCANGSSLRNSVRRFLRPFPANLPYRNARPVTARLMRLPAVAIAIAFSLGVALGLWPTIGFHQNSKAFIAAALVFIFTFILGSFLLLIRQHLRIAGILSLVAWLTLGWAAAAITSEPQPANYVVNLIDANKIDLQTPLRWRGTLRDEPAILPWGVSMEIALAEVDYQERAIAIQGGMRLTYAPRPGDAALPDVHCSDEIAVITQARLPQLFRDEGAFDRRSYLRSQGVDLTAALRSPDLLEQIASAKPSPRTMLARIRRNL